MDKMASLTAIVRGRVQGVYFRAFVMDEALQRGLKGCVRNLPSGIEVEVQAEGSQSQLEELIKQLWKGPRGSWVRDVQVSWHDFSGEFDDFQIK